METSQQNVLTWNRVSLLGQKYELRWGDRVVGTFASRGLTGARASAHMNGEDWLIHRKGYLRVNVHIQAEGLSHNIASFRQRSLWRYKGVIHIHGIRDLELRPANFWQTRWTVQDAFGRSLIRMRASHLTRKVLTLEVLSTDVSAEEVGIIAVIGLSIRRISDNAGGA